MKIVRTDAELHLPTLDDLLIDEGHELILLPDGIAEDDLIRVCHDADILMMCYTPITRRVIEAAPRLRGIVKYGVGIDAIDIPAAKKNGVIVVNVPEYAENTVAEGAFTLMLALLRKLPALTAAMRTDGWTWPEPRWLGRDLSGLTVGLVGLGRIGHSMARMCGRGFGANVIAHDPHQPDSTFQAAGAERVALGDLLKRADVVSLHTVLTEETRHLIGANELALMRSDAILVNVSRGPLIDESALISALDEGWIAGAGLDVFEREPLSRDHPLQNRDNVILLPHLTFWTHQAMARLEEDTLARLRELIENRPVTIRSKDPRLQGQKGASYS
ncbi:2-hydroxyacid dehydrogenase [Silicimonas sp. MF1-12-2]|uniref:2-hydroxyacid dehydrogenase n=1 Tax=Silicimonas sp. MF1-12-2 TaxID=3384793 RepID=UPI0039B68575